MRKHLLTLTSAAALALPGAVLADDLSLTVSGGWSPYVDEAQLTGGAGSNLTPTLASDGEDITLEVSGTQDASDTWRVLVRREESPFWDKDLQIEIRRVTDGDGDGAVTGGSSYTVLTTTDTVLFTGEGDRSDIQIQLRLTGLSVGAVAPDVSLTHITYSIVDT